MHGILILMLKYPRPGTVKTRLIPALGERRACELYESLVRLTLEVVRGFARERAVRLAACVANAPGETAASEWLGSGVELFQESSGDLGRRMELAARQAFAQGAGYVMILGADCPALTAGHLHATVSALATRDLVLGPAVDGGYYLIAMRRHFPELFREIDWSTARVLQQTLTTAREADVNHFLLEELPDIDGAEDLPVWAKTARARAMGQGRISLIIPAYNEAEVLSRTIAAAHRGEPGEIIVVDGGSSDATMELARSQDAIVLSGPDCRAAQMNKGAAISTGEYLLFLHADTLLPNDYPERVRSLLQTPEVAAGAFRFSIAERFPGRSLVERATNRRSIRRQLPYGDQGLFLRADRFAEAGGFREMPIMEDYELVRRLRRVGRIALAESAVLTSGRRWVRLGWLRTTLINQAMILGYHLGISPARLAAWYRGTKSPRITARDSAEAPVARPLHRATPFASVPPAE